MDVKARKARPPAKPATVNKVRRSQVERTAESDGRMFEAATKLLLERGMHGTTLKDVGELAGYSRGLASGRFGTKEALFSAMLSEFNQKWKQEIDGFVDGQEGMNAFDAAIRALEHFLLSEAEYIRAMYILYFEALASSEVLRSRLAEQHQAYRADVARWIEQGIVSGTVRPTVSSGRVAVQYCSFVFGLVYQWLVSPEDIDVEAALEDFRLAVPKLIMANDQGSSAGKDSPANSRGGGRTRRKREDALSAR